MANFPEDLCLTHRLSLADQKLVELLQQRRLPDNLPTHVGVPGLLVRIPEGDDTQGKLSFYSCPVCLSSFDATMSSYQLRA